MATSGFPAAIRKDVDSARRLVWWHIGWTISIIIVMGLAMGGSQAMKTAWIEDALGLVPALVFLVSIKLEARPPTARYPFGLHRVNSLGFMIAAVALAAVGGFLLIDAGMTLIMAEKIELGQKKLFGFSIWEGWVMIAAQVYAIIPPFIIGRREQVLGKRLRDKLLHTDALMNRANWMTGAAGIAGIGGIGLGFWWADAVAAGVISLSIINDGSRAMRIAAAELVDGAPRSLDSPEISHEAQLIAKALRKRFPKAKVQLRETGRYIRAEVIGVPSPKNFDVQTFKVEGLEDDWRLESVTFAP